ncbi:MAG: glycoside hydrolase family 55 protein [Gemmatimonadaceae bacterium]|nr:glycoside hydrolase family 55 protein [Gemmatimonadaceae bacterium]
MKRFLLPLILAASLLGGVALTSTPAPNGDMATFAPAPFAPAGLAYASPSASIANPIGGVTLEEFGGVANDSSVDNTPALNAAITYIASHRNETASRLYLPAVGTYWLKSKPGLMQGVTIIGAGMTKTGIRFDFDATGGALEWAGDSAGGLEDIALTVNDGRHISNAVWVHSKSDGTLSSFQHFYRVWISYTGSGSYGETFLVQDLYNGWGGRDIECRELYVFGGTQDAVWLRSVKNFRWFGGGTFRGDYNGSMYIYGGGPSFAQQSINVLMMTSVDGNLSVNYSSDVLYMGVVANSYGASNSSSVKFVLTKN